MNYLLHIESNESRKNMVPDQRIRKQSTGTSRVKTHNSIKVPAFEPLARGRVKKIILSQSSQT